MWSALWLASILAGPVILILFFAYLGWEYRPEIRAFWTKNVIDDVPASQAECGMCNRGECSGCQHRRNL